MARMKTFLKYLIWFVAFFLFASYCSNVFVKKAYDKIDNYSIQISTPHVDVLEAMATKHNGYIKGNITNNTNAMITEKYVKIDFYSKNNNYLGTKYIELDSFQTGKTLEFNQNFSYSNVGRFEIGLEENKENVIGKRVLKATIEDLALALLGIIIVMKYI